MSGPENLRKNALQKMNVFVMLIFPLQSEVDKISWNFIVILSYKLKINN